MSHNYAMNVGPDEIQQVVEALRADPTTQQSIVANFERKVASFVRNPRTVVVNNGTSAILCALIAHRLKPGDKVAIPAYAFAAVANAVLLLGGTPVLVDSEEPILNLDLVMLRELLEEQPDLKGVIHVDVAGLPPDISRLHKTCHEFDLWLIEDAAEGLGSEYKGARVGSFSHTTVFSFHPAKQITTMEGGAICAGNDEIYERCLLIRNHGMKEQYLHLMPGLNLRLSPLDAALGLAQIERIESFLLHREKTAQLYRDLLAPRLEFQRIPDFVTRMSWGMVLAFAGRQSSRDSLLRHLESRGIRCVVPWRPIHLQPFFRGLSSGLFPRAERLYSRVLSLPLSNVTKEADARRTVDAANEFFDLAIDIQ